MNYKTIKILLYTSILTSSFDVFLVFNLGFNFRFSQLILFPVMFVTILPRIFKRSIKPLGFLSLLIWFYFMVAFIPSVPYINKSIGYVFWLLLNIMVIFIFVNMFDNDIKIKNLIKFYLVSFGVIAGYGLLQFFVPLLTGIEMPYTIYSLIPGRLVRINGFSYEPSFFASYMLMGWVLVQYFKEKKLNIFSPKQLNIISLIITAAMLLSSSRMGILGMLTWYAKYPVIFLLNLMRGHWHTKSFIKLSFLSVFIVLTIFTLISFFGRQGVLLLLEGTGVFGTGDHSTAGRFNVMLNTFNSFKDSPIIGYSLGGVSVANALAGGVPSDQLSIAFLKGREGMSIYAEVLAASGIIGIIPFIVYSYSIHYKPLLLSKKLIIREEQVIIAGLAIALIFETLILQLNQNILRPYYWMHIAILSSVYCVYQRKHNLLNTRRTINYVHNH